MSLFFALLFTLLACFGIPLVWFAPGWWSGALAAWVAAVAALSAVAAWKRWLEEKG